MKYQQSTMTTGAWVKSINITNGTVCKIVSETKPQPSNFTDKEGNPKNQDVCKVRIEGENEPLNVSLNRATINGLIQSFGDDSSDWQNHPLTMETEKMRVAGKAVVALYLIADGYEKIDDANGYAVILKKGESLDMDANDMPF